MSVLEVVRSYYDYNEWANNHLLETASSLSDEDLRRELGASFGSVRGNITHVAGAQIVWLGRWTGERSSALALLGDLVDFDSIREAFERSHAHLKSFVSSRSDADLDAPARYRDRDGNNQRAALWQLMLQVVNHGTQHRAEAAMILTSLGLPVRDLDFILFELERA